VLKTKAVFPSPEAPLMNKIALPFALILLAAGAVVHGATTRRWAAVTPDAGRFEGLHRHAVELGDFQSTQVPDDMPLKEKSVATNRRYFSPQRNCSVVVSVITGAPGSVATHTPDVCYPGSGYKVVKSPARETLDVLGLGAVSYYVAEFEKKTATTTDRQRVRWAWANGGKWEAPDAPRFAYLRVADLAKVYIVTAVPPGEPARTAESADVTAFMSAAFAQYADRVAGR